MPGLQPPFPTAQSVDLHPGSFKAGNPTLDRDPRPLGSPSHRTSETRNPEYRELQPSVLRYRAPLTSLSAEGVFPRWDLRLFFGDFPPKSLPLFHTQRTRPLDTDWSTLAPSFRPRLQPRLFPMKFPYFRKFLLSWKLTFFNVTFPVSFSNKSQSPACGRGWGGQLLRTSCRCVSWEL